MKLIFVFLFLMISVFMVQAYEKYIVTSDSVKLYVHVKGSGPACIYLHGGPGSGSYWLEKFTGDFLEQKFQMIYLDQRGVGRSSSPADNNYSLERMIMDFEEVRESLGIQSWLTLGHSFGGILQMAYANGHPGVNSGMIFINCTLSMNDSFKNSWLPKAFELTGDDTPAVSRDTTVSVYQRMLSIMPVPGEKGEMWKIFFDAKENSQRMNETYSGFDTWNSDQSEKILEIPEYWDDFRKFTPEFKKPVLFYYGKNDWAIGAEHYKGVAFPKMQLWGSDVGHFPFLENKNDLMNAINSFMNNNQF
jgi:proline iminopeptidase